MLRRPRFRWNTEYDSTQLNPIIITNGITSTRHIKLKLNLLFRQNILHTMTHNIVARRAPYMRCRRMKFSFSGFVGIHLSVVNTEYGPTYAEYRTIFYIW